MKPPNTSSRGLRLGFTLIELLAVMTIMAILLSILAPSIAGINESNNITGGGQLFADQVALARQMASARNITVEVRCIVVPSRSASGYSATQLWSVNSGMPISRVQNLPDGIVISQDQTEYSTLFANYNSAVVQSGSPPTNTTLTMPAGPFYGDTYAGFTVSPSGMVGPLVSSSGSAETAPDMKNLSVGVVPERYATTTTLVKNYMLVQINPLTAATLNYRP